MLLGIIGGQELIVILIIALLLFGGKKLPELMRGLGRGVKEYKDAMKDLEQPSDTQKPKDSSTDSTTDTGK